MSLVRCLLFGVLLVLVDRPGCELAVTCDIILVCIHWYSSCGHIVCAAIVVTDSPLTWLIYVGATVCGLTAGFLLWAAHGTCVSPDCTSTLTFLRTSAM